MTAKTLYDNISEEIPGASNVEKYPAYEAKRTLVHVKQIHRHPFWNLMPSVPTPNSVRAVQRDMAQIVQYFAENDITRNVYSEGLSPLGKAYIERAKRKINGTSKDLDLEEHLANIYLDALSFLKRRGESLEKKKERLEKHFGQEIATMYIDGVIDIVEASSYWQTQKALSSIGTHGIDESNDCLFRNREEYVLELLSEKDEKMGLTIYGMGHDWKPDVERWNKNHPKDQFNLVVVTPTSTKIGEDRDALLADQLNWINEHYPKNTREQIVADIFLMGSDDDSISDPALERMEKRIKPYEDFVDDVIEVVDGLNEKMTDFVDAVGGIAEIAYERFEGLYDRLTKD